MFEQQNTSNKVLLTITLFLITVFIVAFIGLQEIEKQIRSDVGKALNIVLQTTQESHDIWIENYKSNLNLITKNPELISLVEQLLNEPGAPEYLLASPTTKKLRHHFDASRTGLVNEGFFIISKDRISIGSMRDENLGTTNLIAQQRPKLLEKAFNGETIFVPPIHSDVPLQDKSINNSPTMFFVAPIKSKNKILALLTLRIPPDYDFTRLTQTGRIGETGETYAFNQSGVMITNSRFDHHLHQIGLISKNEPAILNVRISDPGVNMLEGFKPVTTNSNLPLTLMAKSAISGNADINVQGYRDYRGVTVLGAWLWNSDLGYGLTTEIDEQEALKSYEITKNIVLYIIVIMLFLSLTLGIIIYLLEQRARSIKASHDNLELQVKERTSELTITNEELEKTINNLRTLEGIIPICGYCKNIRNDEGSWDKLEKYLSHHTDAKFSHGICPKCLKKARAENDLSEE